MKKEIEHLVTLVIEKYDSNKWVCCESLFIVEKGSFSLKIRFKNDAGDFREEDNDILIRSFSLQDRILESYNDSLTNPQTRFSHFELTIFPDGSYKERYWWDQALEYEQKLRTAKYFYSYINERFMGAIFEYEKDNGLLAPYYDDDGEFTGEYESSWDEAYFSFEVINNFLKMTIELIKDGQSRFLDTSFLKSFERTILKHHLVTNQELKEWQPWNKLVIKSPHKEIPLDKRDDFIVYSLEAKNS